METFDRLTGRTQAKGKPINQASVKFVNKCLINDKFVCRNCKWKKGKNAKSRKLRKNETYLQGIKMGNHYRFSCKIVKLSKVVSLLEKLDSQKGHPFSKGNKSKDLVKTSVQPKNWIHNKETIQRKQNWLLRFGNFEKNVLTNEKTKWKVIA